MTLSKLNVTSTDRTFDTFNIFDTLKSPNSELLRYNEKSPLFTGLRYIVPHYLEKINKGTADAVAILLNTGRTLNKHKTLNV